MPNQHLEFTVVAWALVIFGAITLLPLMLNQLTIFIRPDSQRAKDILIGNGGDWRDKMHFRSAYGLCRGLFTGH